MEQVKTHLRGSKKYVLMRVEDFNDFLRRFRIQNYEYISKRIHDKGKNKEAIIIACNGAIKSFRDKHPDALDGMWQQSLAKRIGGAVYSWIYNDKKLKDIKSGEGITAERKRIFGRKEQENGNSGN